MYMRAPLPRDSLSTTARLHFIGIVAEKIAAGSFSSAIVLLPHLKYRQLLCFCWICLIFAA